MNNPGRCQPRITRGVPLVVRRPVPSEDTHLAEDAAQLFLVRAGYELEGWARGADVVAGEVDGGFVELEPVGLAGRLAGFEEDEADERQRRSPLHRLVQNRIEHQLVRAVEGATPSGLGRTATRCIKTVSCETNAGPPRPAGPPSAAACRDCHARA